MESSQFIGIAVFLGVVIVMLILIFIKTNVVICSPNEIVIISGRKRKGKDGITRGYRIIRGGRGFKWPFLESVSRLSLTTRTINVAISRALSAGMIPLEIDGRSNIKLAGNEKDGLENGVERFLGKGEEVIDKTAQQVIEGAVRGVLASMSPSEANEKRIELVSQVMEISKNDLKQLGIVIDSFQILSISDKHGHLEAIGRKRNAEVQKEAKIAEAKADAEARTVSAEQVKLGREAEIKSELSIVNNEKELAVTKANHKAESNSAEIRAELAREIAESEERVQLESLNIDVSKKHHEAQTIIPAEAKMKAMSLESQGYAARIFENGAATAKAVELMKEQYDEGNNHDLFVLRMLPELHEKAAKVIADNLNIEKLTILDSGNGEGVPTFVQNLTNSTTTFLEHLKNTTGIDIGKTANKSFDSKPNLPSENK